MSIRDKIIESVASRMQTEITKFNSIKIIKDWNAEDLVDCAIPPVYSFTRPTKMGGAVTLFVELISAIGHSILRFHEKPKDSSIAAKIGAFVLYSFEELGLISHKLSNSGKSSNNSYIVEMRNERALLELWEALDITKTEKLPYDKPLPEWTSGYLLGHKMVKTGSHTVLNNLHPDKQPIVFKTLNAAQAVGWKINKEIHTLVLWALTNKTDAFSDIWEQTDVKARVSKTREAKAIHSIASKFLDKTFYHLYYYDFRYRKYPATAYLHEQGSDLAKSLIMRADSKPLTDRGFFWLIVQIANNWAGSAGRPDGLKTDKIPLIDRFKWAVENESQFIEFAIKPKTSTGWMNADNPWQFLSACIELRKFRMWQLLNGTAIKNGSISPFGYLSSFEGYLDGSNNGSQHLAALTRDDITAPYVNLTPQELPGDLYEYVAGYAWDKIDMDCASLSEEALASCTKVIDIITREKKLLNSTEPDAPAKKDMYEKYRNFKKEFSEEMVMAAPVFWRGVTQKKDRRKIVKRNVMTIPYGGTPYGLGKQQQEDARRHGIAHIQDIEQRWATYMGHLIFNTAKQALKRPMKLLSLFERAGQAAEERGEFLRWKVPITNALVIQHYTEGNVKKIWVQYGPPKGPRKSTGWYENSYQIHVCFIENQVMSKGKQSQGASPNIIHSLDAAHLMLVVTSVDFPVTTIHDSYGALLADMDNLFIATRQQFVRLYQNNPLYSIVEDIGGDISEVDFGNLDITQICNSEYAFS